MDTFLLKLSVIKTIYITCTIFKMLRYSFIHSFAIMAYNDNLPFKYTTGYQHNLKKPLGFGLTRMNKNVYNEAYFKNHWPIKQSIFIMVKKLTKNFHNVVKTITFRCKQNHTIDFFPDLLCSQKLLIM